jgi:hypothetical protein
VNPEDNRGFVFNDRPIIGQSEIVQRLTGLIELHSRCGAVFPHILLLGPRGSGRRTIAHALARKLKVSLREAQAAAVARGGDLAAIVSGLEEGDVLLLKEIHRLARPVKEVLCIAMKNFELNIVVGKGMGARTMPLAVKPFTCVGAAERLSDCEDDLVRSFGLVMSLKPYSEPKMVTLASRLAADAGIAIEAAAIDHVARLAEGNPGKIKMLLERLTLSESQPVTEAEAENILSAFGYHRPSPGGGPTSGPADLSNLTGIEFERLIVTLLKNLGFQAEMTKATGDGGIDIEAVLDRPIVGGRYLIQCKRLAANTLVGSPTVREFYGALVADRRAAKGILITTSDFSAQAREFAKNLPVELIDGAKLADLLARSGS